jgi:hypothetical protein
MTLTCLTHLLISQIDRLFAIPHGLRTAFSKAPAFLSRRSLENRAIDLLELSSDQVGDRATEFLEGIVRTILGNGKRSSVPPRKAVIAARDERSIPQS